MSFREWAFKRSLASLVILGFVAFQPAWGQAKNSPIAFSGQDAITVSFLNAPNFPSTDSSGSTSLSTEPAMWMKVEFHYGMTSLVTQDYPYVDAVQFKIWIEGLDPYAKDAPVPGKGVAVTLTGEETYLNIPMARDCYGVFYVHPGTLVRYGGDRGQDNFDRKYNIHIEAYVNGALMDRIDRWPEDNPDWWKPLRATPSLVLRSDQSPFIITDTSKYPMLKPLVPAQ